MATEWEASNFIRSVKRRALLPTADATYSDDDFLAMADEETRVYCVPLLKELNEEWLVRRYDLTLDAREQDGLPYDLPPRCAAEAMKAVLWGDGQGNFTLLPRIEPERSSTGAAGFYLLDDKLYLAPAPFQAPAVRILYFHRPSRLVLEDTIATVAALPGGDDLTVTEGAEVSGLTDGATCDIVSATPGFRIKQQDIGLTTRTVGVSTSYDFDETIDSAVAVGDYVCPAGTTPVPQLPAHMHPLLAQRVAVKLLEGKNDVGYEKALGALNDLESRVRSLFSQRTIANPRPLQNYFAPGWRGRGGYRRRLL